MPIQTTLIKRRPFSREVSLKQLCSKYMPKWWRETLSACQINGKSGENKCALFTIFSFEAAYSCFKGLSLGGEFS